MATAYLIVICDKDTNAVKGAEIWSSPEWEQSQQLPHPTFVAYQVNARSYDEARHYLIKTIRHPGSRYHWLMKYLTEYRAVEMVEAAEVTEAMATETETETNPENMIDPSCDWVEIVDPEHVLRAGVDWVRFKSGGDWVPVKGLHGNAVRVHKNNRFRCLRRDHPDYQKTEPAPEPEPFPHYQPPTVRELLHAVIDEMKKPEHDEPAMKQKPPLGIMPLRWVENCKPDKPGIWGQLNEKGVPIALMVHPGDVCAAWWEPATRCYLGPIPEILPPKKKVVQRLWIQFVGSEHKGFDLVKQVWLPESQDVKRTDFIRTGRTREVER